MVLHRDHDQGLDRRGCERGGVMGINVKIKKATTHISQNEGLIFEKSSPGKKAYKLPPLDVPAVDAAELLGELTRVNETVARLTGLAEAHPYQPEKISQGALRIIQMLSDQLIEITGMDAITLQPAAGAHGELTGILLVRAYLESQGN